MKEGDGRRKVEEGERTEKGRNFAAAVLTQPQQPAVELITRGLLDGLDENWVENFVVFAVNMNHSDFEVWQWLSHVM